jgi:glycosyltransferase involved in cell wall biosynthesis
MNVALLIRDPIEQPGSRLRALQWVPHLEREGFAVKVLPWAVRSRADVARYAVAAAQMARWADVTVLFKPCQPARLIDLLRRSSRRTLVDFDDAVWAPIPGQVSQPWHERLRRRLIHAVRSADGVLVGSHQLAHWCADVAPSVPVTWMPTCVDLDDYTDAKRSWDGPPVVGWIGSSANLRDLEIVGTVLRDLIAEGRASLTVVCDRPSQIDGLPSRFVRWSLERESYDLLGLDIGIMPLEDSERSRGRCGFKAIQYMASGLPVVSSAVPGPSEVVTDGVTGCIAADENAWRRHLEGLVSDASLRQRLGVAGRADAEARFTLQANLARFVCVLAGTR